MRRIPSSASINAISPTARTPTTPSLTPGASAVTDDEETDFQSAYSTSPRGSNGSLDRFAVKAYDPDEQHTPTSITAGAADHLDEFGPQRDAAFKGRERNFSTSTATNAKYRLKSRTSEDTVGGRV